MLTIDGSEGEGGGQVLRTALGLSVVTGTPFVLENIRAGRKKPGLMRQHLTCVRAATRVGAAYVEGDELGSGRLRFEPSGLHGGTFRFSIGSAGSTTLVLQTILPALLLADGPSTVELEGGTHNPWAPPIPFLELSFLAVLRRMGARVGVTLDRVGFAPAGGGRFSAAITPPADGLQRVDLLRRGPIRTLKAWAVVANLSPRIGHREMKRFKAALGLVRSRMSVEEVDAFGPGNAVFLQVDFKHGTVVFDGVGRKGKPAEEVADEVIEAAKAWMAADVPVDEYLADQLLIPMALAGGGRFRTVEPSLHTRTNATMVERFLPVSIDFDDEGDDAWMVRVEPRL